MGDASLKWCDLASHEVCVYTETTNMYKDTLRLFFPIKGIHNEIETLCVSGTLCSILWIKSQVLRLLLLNVI